MELELDPTALAAVDASFDSLDLDGFQPDTIDFDFSEPLDLDPSSQLPVSDLSNGNTPAVSDNTGVEDDETQAADADLANRPYYSKRPHKKSRAGCVSCKRRKVKCDEGRPACRACTLRKETCVYPKGQQAPAVAKKSAASKQAKSSPSPPRGDSSPSSSVVEIDPGQMVYKEPLFIPEQLHDAMDMKMLWFYTAETFSSFALDSRRSASINYILRVRMVEHAFQSPFLMDCLKGLASQHLQILGQPIPQQRAVAYRQRAFAGYRKAIETADPKDFPALLACSLLMTAVSSQTFHESDRPPLYIIEWMQVWRGIGLIVDLISPASILESGLAVLFYRPPIDTTKTTRYIPNNLLFMVSSINQGDDDYPHQQVYYDTLKYLGSLWMELEQGFSAILDLRIITFCTFLPKDFIPLAREHRPRALIILAYYLCFVKIARRTWWMQGITKKELPNICEYISDEWAPLMRIPRTVSQLESETEIARALIDNHDWVPGEVDMYERYGDPRGLLKLVNDDGEEYEIVNGNWQLKPSGVLLKKMREANPNGMFAIDGEDTLLGMNSPPPAYDSASPPKSSSSARVSESPPPAPCVMGESPIGSASSPDLTGTGTGDLSGNLHFPSSYIKLNLAAQSISSAVEAQRRDYQSSPETTAKWDSIHRLVSRDRPTCEHEQ